MIGRTISHYQILERLGSGGMAVVYKAHDRQLDRWVALKFLRGRTSPQAAAFLLREARAASALDHPNICTVYEMGQSDGEHFIAMAFYEGETLGHRLARGPVPVAEALEIAIGVGHGLQRAHQSGIVHLDIKPHNVMLVARSDARRSADGVKILDFGIARLGGGGEEASGKIYGSMPYMAPERFNRGRQAIPQSDVWSLGVMLYEMLAGENPFRRGESAEMARAIREQSFVPITSAPIVPVPTASMSEPVADNLNAVLRKSLDRDLDQRYRDASEMVRDLEAVTKFFSSSERTHAVSVPPELTQSADSSIAILPFSDQSPDRDQEHLCYGLAEELVRLLTSLSRVRVASFISMTHPPEEGMRADLGRQLRVATALEGSVYKAGDRIRVIVRLIRTVDGQCLWSDKYDREFKDLFDIQDEIAERIVLSLELTLMPTQDVRSSRDHEAYELLLKGRYHWNRRTEQETKRGIDFFEQAIARDPGQARAWAGLADSYAMQCIYSWVAPKQVMPRALDAAQQALANDPRLADAYASRACVRAVHDWNFAAAEQDFGHAIELDPSYAIAYQWSAMNALLPLGRFEQARQRLREARESDPMSLPIISSLGIYLFYRRRYAEAIEEFEKALEIDDSFVPALLFLAHSHTALERFEQACQELEKAERVAGPRADILAGLGYNLALMGAGHKVKVILDRLYQLGREGYVSPSLRAQIYVALGRPRVAIDALRAAIDGRAADIIWLGLHPFFEPLHDEEDFQTLLAMVGLETFGD